MHSLEFERLHIYADPLGIAVPITLRAGREAVDLPARVDTGSEYCIFERAYGERLGLQIEAGDQKRIGTASGSAFRAFGHMVTLEFLEYSLESMVYFAEDVGFNRNVLGRNGWLNRCRIAIVDHDQLLYVSPYTR